jgi:Histidine phosphatase superfamily (branch 1)
MPIPQVFLDSGETVTSPVMDEFAVDDESDVVTPPAVPPPPAPTPQNTMDASSVPHPGRHTTSVPADTKGATTPPAASTTKPRKPSPPLPARVKVVEKPQMLEINPGIWDGLSPEQAKKYYPLDWKRFTKDPYSYRAPRAESYHDLSGA